MGSEYESSDGEREENEADMKANKDEDAEFEEYVEKSSNQIQQEDLDSDNYNSD